MPRHISYQEGDWFAVPLEDSSFAVGVVARMDGKGSVLGYFFGPKRNPAPPLSEIATYTARDKAMVCIFGDFGLTKGYWPVIGQKSLWIRTQWPMPAFGFCDALTKHYWKREYNAETFALLRQVPISHEAYFSLPMDGLFGYGAVEGMLTHILAGQ